MGKGFSIMQNRLSSGTDPNKLKWVYFPRMQRDEIICFQQGDLTMHSQLEGAASSRIEFPDSARDHATFHGAFEDPTALADAPPRQSIEAGAFVFLPEEPEMMSTICFEMLVYFQQFIGLLPLVWWEVAACTDY